MKNIIKNSQKRFGRIILVIINILLILRRFCLLWFIPTISGMKNADADRCVLFHYGRNEAGFRKLSEDGEGICRELGKLHRTPEYDDG